MVAAHNSTRRFYSINRQLYKVSIIICPKCIFLYGQLNLVYFILRHIR